jgi:hypothetical protein
MEDNERLVIEYQKAQDSAEHHDSLLWTVTSIIWAGNLVLLGLVLVSIKNKDLRIILTFLSVFGILLVVSMFLFAILFSYIKRQKYKRCKDLEETLGFKQHKELKYPNCVQTLLYFFITIIFLIIWVAVMVTVWT